MKNYSKLTVACILTLFNSLVSTIKYPLFKSGKSRFIFGCFNDILQMISLK